ncbi:hypothetical protein DFH08DRAFT_819973 [Mycena albidolilacea]|uniref:Uncharacterized protein n=1 Tax=Mycena albidolilacea TaxID=1033008 RepID=A0AAD7EEI5_9AGAR|nr:hypothetical protein DFH08DRAFT_819973 [Mycena albidolilacea]
MMVLSNGGDYTELQTPITGRNGFKFKILELKTRGYTGRVRGLSTGLRSRPVPVPAHTRGYKPAARGRHPRRTRSGAGCTSSSARQAARSPPPSRARATGTSDEFELGSEGEGDNAHSPRRRRLRRAMVTTMRGAWPRQPHATRRTGGRTKTKTKMAAKRTTTTPPPRTRGTGPPSPSFSRWRRHTRRPPQRPPPGAASSTDSVTPGGNILSYLKAHPQPTQKYPHRLIRIPDSEAADDMGAANKIIDTPAASCAVNAEDLGEGSKAQPQHSEVLSPTPQMSPAPFEARCGSGSNASAVKLESTWIFKGFPAILSTLETLIEIHPFLKPAYLRFELIYQQYAIRIPPAR